MSEDADRSDHFAWSSGDLEHHPPKRMPLQLASLRRLLHRAINEGEATVLAHIAKMASEKSTGGIEQAFANQFHALLDETWPGFFRYGAVGKKIGIDNYYGNRKNALIDAYCAEMKLAFEYKAVAVPPKPNQSELYYIGQIVPDFLRLYKSENIKYGFVIIFAYGRSLEERSKRSIYKIVHNQLFVDCEIVRMKKLKNLTNANCEDAIQQLGWRKPFYSSALPETVFVAKGNRTAAICYTAKYAP